MGNVMTTKRTRIVEIDPSFDKRKSGYGIRSAMLRMILKGDEGAVQFVMSTGWYLESINLGLGSMRDPMGFDLGYHSPKPMYEDQGNVMDDCPYLDGKPCYYDGSSLRAMEVTKLLIEKGHEAVWAYLEEEYDRKFLEEGINNE